MNCAGDEAALRMIEAYQRLGASIRRPSIASTFGLVVQAQFVVVDGALQFGFQGPDAAGRAHPVPGKKRQAASAGLGVMGSRCRRFGSGCPHRRRRPETSPRRWKASDRRRGYGDVASGAHSGRRTMAANSVAQSELQTAGIRMAELVAVETRQHRRLGVGVPRVRSPVRPRRPANSVATWRRVRRHATDPTPR